MQQLAAFFKTRGVYFCYFFTILKNFRMFYFIFFDFKKLKNKFKYNFINLMF